MNPNYYGSNQQIQKNNLQEQWELFQKMQQMMPQYNEYIQFCTSNGLNPKDKNSFLLFKELDSHNTINIPSNTSRNNNQSHIYKKTEMNKPKPRQNNIGYINPISKAQYHNDNINITFVLDNRSFVKVSVPKETTIAAMIQKYFNQIGVHLNHPKKEYQFLYNGREFDPSSYELVSSKFINNTKIIVIKNNVQSFHSQIVNTYYPTTSNSKYQQDCVNISNLSTDTSKYINSDYYYAMDDGFIPRGDTYIYLEYKQPSEYNIINIEFRNNEGFSTILSVPGNITISEMIKRYLDQNGLGDQYLRKSFMFLYKKGILDESSNDNVSSKFKNNDIIIVSDYYSQYSSYLQFCQLRNLNSSLESSFLLFFKYNIGKIYNKPNNNQNINNNYKPYIKNQQPKELFPRHNYIHNSPETATEQNMQIIFETLNGSSVTLSIPGNMEMTEMFKLYMDEIGLPFYHLENDLQFLNNGVKLDPSSNKIVKNKLKNMDKIIVVDINELIKI